MATCRSGAILVDGNFTHQPFVVGVLDVRDPACNAPGFGTPLSDPTVNWLAPMYHNEAGLSPTGLKSDEWTVGNLGEVFGVAIDDNAAPNIYVTSTRAYGNGTGTGSIFKLDGMTGAPTLFASLPNDNTGLGNVAFDPVHRQLFVTNMEDGRIYRFSLDGTLLSIFDPFNGDDGNPGFAPLGERIWAVQAFNCRLYFGTWNEDAARPGPANEVWSIALDPFGEFDGLELLEVTLPVPANGTTMPISDIAFSRTGSMMIAERGMSGDLGQAPHRARVLEYAGGHLNWSPSGATFDVGFINNGTNSAGGVDYDCAEADSCNLGGHVLATGDALHCCTSPNNIYGLQILPDSGGDLSNSYIVDLDGGTHFQDKTQIGDVDSVRTCHPPTDQCFLDQGCTYTQGYWKNHNKHRKSRNQRLPWPIAEETLLCGQTWLEILNTPVHGDVWTNLAHQWIAAQLNAANGASIADVATVLQEAEALLLDCSIDTGDEALALALKDVLDAYNNGLIGPGSCE